MISRHFYYDHAQGLNDFIGIRHRSFTATEGLHQGTIVPASGAVDRIIGADDIRRAVHGRSDRVLAKVGETSRLQGLLTLAPSRLHSVCAAWREPTVRANAVTIDSP